MHTLCHWKEDMLNIPLPVYIVNCVCLLIFDGYITAIDTVPPEPAM